MSPNAALTALDAGSPEEAIALLVAAWRQTRDPATAEALDGLSRWVRARGRGIEAKTAAARARQFDALVAAGRPADLEFLIDGIGNEKLEEARRRVEALRAFAPDPRLSRGLIELVAKLPFSARSAMPFWTLVSDVIAACADPRAAEAIGGIPARLVPLVGSERTAMIETKLRKVTAALDKAGPPRALAADERAAVEALLLRVRALGGRAASGSDEGEGEELLAAVYETPEADEPRQVYADWLQERGDPRGELIALQLARAASGEAPSLRERKLLGTHGKAWLGPLGRGRILDEKRTRFARGFFAAGSLLARGIDTIHGHREWATCEDLDVGNLPSGSLRTFLRDPVMRGLHTLRRLPIAMLWELADEPLRRPLVEVGLREPASTGQLARLARRDGLPALRRVLLVHDRDLRVGDELRGALAILDGDAFELVGLSTGVDRVEVWRGAGETRLDVVPYWGTLEAATLEGVGELLASGELRPPLVVRVPDRALDGERRVGLQRTAESVGARVEISR